MSAEEFMKKSGIPVYLKGYEYAKEAIEIHVENPSMFINEIINRIAEKRFYSYTAVERNIYNAVAKGYEYMDQEIKKIVFGMREEIPTTGQFIIGASYAIRNKLI